MDYMEGLFLGSLWSDTDYENRRHINLFILYGVLVCGIVVLSSFTGQFADLLNDLGRQSARMRCRLLQGPVFGRAEPRFHVALL